MQNPFADLIPEQQTGPVVIGTPRPRQAAPVTPNQDRYTGAQADRTEAEAKFAEDKARADAAKAGYDATAAGVAARTAQQQAARREALAGNARSQLQSLLERIDRIRADVKDNGGWGETGWTGSALRKVPGTAAYDLAASLETLDASAAFKALQQMREESPTGGALGQITERELALLKSTISNLDPNQSQESFLRSLDVTRKVYSDMLSRLPGSDALPFKERNALFQDKIRSGASYDEVARYAGELGLTFDPEQLKRAIGRKDAQVVGEEPAAPGIGSQLWDATTNTIAGLGEGAAAIIDIPTRALGATLGEAADFLGWEEGAENLRNPITIGGTIESVRPVPKDGAGWWARQASRLTGGAASLPRAATTAVAERVAGRVPPRPPSQPPALPSVGRAAKDLNIRVAPALTGGPVTRAVSALSAQTPVGAAFAARAASNTADDAVGALSGIARGEGAVVNAETAGEVATKGALAFRDTSRTAASRLYDQAGRAAGDTRVVPSSTIAALDRNIAQMAENPAGADSLPYFTVLRDTLAQKFPNGVTVQGIRDMRTSLRDKFYKDGLRGSDIERRVMQAVDSVGDDLAESLHAAGKSEAATLFRQADAAWSSRIKTIDDFIMPIIGRKGEKSGEQVFRALEQAAKGNGARLKGFVGSLPAEEAGTVRASLINALGRARSGAAEDFSLDTFLTRWKDMGETAKRSLFTGEGRAALDKLATIAQAGKRAGRYSNTSNTSGPLLAAGTIASAGFGYQTFGATLMGEAAMGALLSSPKVAHGIARIAAARSPREAEAGIKHLSTLAARNPALAEDIGSLQQRLMEAFTASPASSAAAGQNE